ncbi:MAG: hypothetical protein PUC12_04400 [Clostridiales bacterium]|nr:hypothetical protein [Clostridiales bacterium]
MLKNLVDYFDTEQEFYLDKINYSRINTKDQMSEYALNSIDRIQCEISEDMLKLTVCRTLKFNPEGIFELSVAYGAILKFNQKGKAYDWSQCNLEEEFKKNGQFVTGNLMNRISLLIAEITSSFGQTPLVLPPGFAVSAS